MQNSIKAVIFDFDDTLVKTYETKGLAHIQVAKKFYDLQLTEADIKAVWGQPYETMMLNLYRHKDSFNNLRNAYDSIVAKTQLQPHPGAYDLIQNLHSFAEIGVLTSAFKEHVKTTFTGLGWPLKLFTAIQGAQESQFHKPDPRVFDPMISVFKNYQPKELVYIGDSLMDYLAAKNAGLQFIGITHGMTSKEEFTQKGAVAVDSFSQVLQLLKS